MLSKLFKVKSIFKYINLLFIISYFFPPLLLLNTFNLVKLAFLSIKDYKP